MKKKKRERSPQPTPAPAPLRDEIDELFFGSGGGDGGGDDVEEEDPFKDIVKSPPTHVSPVKKKKTPLIQPKSKKKIKQPVAIAKEKGDKDDNEEEEEEDPSKGAPPLKNNTKKKRPSHRSVIAEDSDDDDGDGDDALSALQSAKTEKERCQALAMILKKQKPNPDDIPYTPSSSQQPPPPTPPRAEVEITKKKKKHQRAPLPKKRASAPAAKAPAHQPCLFPHEDDIARVRDYIWLSTVNTLIAGKIGNPIDHKYNITDYDKLAVTVTLFYKRCCLLRKRVIEGFKRMCSGNAYMTHIANNLHRCKLTVYNKAKYLNPSVAETGDPVYCVWSLKQIKEESDVRTAALTPVAGTASQRNEDVPDPTIEQGVMFHIHTRYANILKCVHTVIFFVDYLNNEIETKVEMVRGQVQQFDDVWNEEVEQEWKQAFTLDPGDVKAKSKPMVALINATQTQLKEICNVLRLEMGDECFTVINK